MQIQNPFVDNGKGGVNTWKKINVNCKIMSELQ